MVQAQGKGDRTGIDPYTCKKSRAKQEKETFSTLALLLNRVTI